MAKNKNPSPLTKEALLARLQEMIELIYSDTLIALEAEAVLEAGNDLLESAGLLNKKLDGGNSFRTIQNSLALNLSISLARLFEEPNKRYHPDNSDIASIPLIIFMFSKDDCREILAETAKKWTQQIKGMEDIHLNACTKAIDSAEKKYKDLKESEDGAKALANLSNFRTLRIAHSLHGKEVMLIPKYSDLFLLMDSARQIIQHTKLAITGEHHDLEVAEKEYYREAEAFWRPAFKGISEVN